MNASCGRKRERRTEDGGDFRVGEQAEHCLGDRAEAERGRLAVGDYVSERTAGTGSEGFDHRLARRGRLHVGCDLRRRDRETLRTIEGTLRCARWVGTQRGVCAGRRYEGRVPEYDSRGVPACPLCKGLFT